MVIKDDGASKLLAGIFWVRKLLREKIGGFGRSWHRREGLGDVFWETHESIHESFFSLKKRGDCENWRWRRRVGKNGPRKKGSAVFGGLHPQKPEDGLLVVAAVAAGVDTDGGKFAPFAPALNGERRNS